MLHVERKLQCTNRPEACNSIHLYWIGFTSDEAYMHCWLILRLNLSPGISGTYSLINNQYIRTAVCIWLFISFKGVGTQFLLVVWVQVTYQFHLYMCTLHLIATRVIEQNANMQTRVIEQNAFSISCNTGVTSLFERQIFGSAPFQHARCTWRCIHTYANGNSHELSCLYNSRLQTGNYFFTK